MKQYEVVVFLLVIASTIGFVLKDSLMMLYILSVGVFMLEYYNHKD